MTITLKPVRLPDDEPSLSPPAIPPETYLSRCRTAYDRAGSDWLVVYGDREHFNNLFFLTGFDPRFEEALLVLGRNGTRHLITGNECLSYAVLAGLPGLEVVLAQTLSLMAQDRSTAPNLGRVLRDLGLKTGDTIGLVGWKYLEPEEREAGRPGFFVPEFIVDVFRRIAGADDRVRDATPVLMHPVTGLASTIDADQIAAYEWAAARASAAVRRIVTGARADESEFAMVSRMGYAGEAQSVHVMLAAAGRDAPVIGLRSPTARTLKRGDGVGAAVGYWGGLCCRAGLLDAGGNDAFLAAAKAYFAGIAAWYETVDIGVRGGDIHAAVTAALAKGGLKPALNPGHLTGATEWTHSPVRPGSDERIASGMPFQVDIIPVPMPNGWALNCEDPVTIADATLRADLKARHPAVHARIEARRAFVADQIGIAIKPSLLPMSAIQLWLPPFWLAADRALAMG